MYLYCCIYIYKVKQDMRTTIGKYIYVPQLRLVYIYS